MFNEITIPENTYGNSSSCFQGTGNKYIYSFWLPIDHVSPNFDIIKTINGVDTTLSPDSVLSSHNVSFNGTIYKVYSAYGNRSTNSFAFDNSGNDRVKWRAVSK